MNDPAREAVSAVYEAESRRLADNPVKGAAPELFLGFGEWAVWSSFA